MRRFFLLILFGSLLVVTGCGGGGSSSNGGSGGGGGAVANTVPTVVNAGPTANSVDSAFVSVTVCVPGTSNCQTVPNVVVDTGSSGLRILKSAIPHLSLPQQNGPLGNPLVECAQFASFFAWGPVMTADIKMAGEVATSAPIQVVGETDTGFPQVPGACAKSAPQDGSTVQGLGGNGILGVGLFLQDCGSACSMNSGNPGFYYECSNGGVNCIQANVPTTQQVPNPVSLFASDNNGVLLQLPQVPATGAPSVSGTMIFGIGTQSNNGLGSATVFTLAGDGTFTTVYTPNGQSYPESFIDSGSNGIFFLTGSHGQNNPGITGIPVCTVSVGFYCPTTTLNLSATNHGTNNASNTVQFSIANADQLPAANFAFNDLGGENAGPPGPSFDWGLAFFFGRSVFTAIENQNTPAGMGPYFAY